jgi:hypothetical protein
MSMSRSRISKSNQDHKNGALGLDDTLLTSL